MHVFPAGQYYPQKKRSWYDGYKTALMLKMKVLRTLLFKPVEIDKEMISSYLI